MKHKTDILIAAGGVVPWLIKPIPVVFKAGATALALILLCRRGTLPIPFLCRGGGMGSASLTSAEANAVFSKITGDTDAVMSITGAVELSPGDKIFSEPYLRKVGQKITDKDLSHCSGTTQSGTITQIVLREESSNIYNVHYVLDNDPPGIDAACLVPFDKIVEITVT